MGVFSSNKEEVFIKLLIFLYKETLIMKYMGSKNRIAKYILPIMLKEMKQNNILTWVEPFVGGGNTIDKIDTIRIGSDSNTYVIQALISIRDYIKELPKNNNEFTEEMYNEIKKSNTYKHKGYASFAFSYAGKFLGGWRRDSENKRDYVKEAYKNAQKQSKLLQGVTLINCDYDKLIIPKLSLIYCDPPYQGTTPYKTGKFDHDKFFDWCREKVKEGHIVYVSEYTAPDDFECVWQGDIKTNFASSRKESTHTATERLFKVKIDT